MKEQSPVNWLWTELIKILPTQDYIDLQIGYQEQQRRYSRQSRLNTARRELALYEHNLRTCHESRRTVYAEKIERRKATIAKLESEC